MTLSRSDQRRDFDVPTRVQILENDADRLEDAQKEFEREARREVAELGRKVDGNQETLTNKINGNQESTNNKIDGVQKAVDARLNKILWAIVGLLISITSAVIVYALTTFTAPGS